MAELATLERRRELLVLAADLQRATVVQRFRHIDTRPSRVAFELATSLARTRTMQRLAFSAITSALLAAWRRKSKS